MRTTFTLLWAITLLCGCQTAHQPAPSSELQWLVQPLASDDAVHPVEAVEAARPVASPTSASDTHGSASEFDDAGVLFPLARDPMDSAGDEPLPDQNAKPMVPGDDEEPWRIHVAPYAWLLGVNGTITVQGNSTRVDQSFSDLADNISFVGEGRVEVWKGRWGAVADVTYARLETDENMGPVNLQSTTDIWLIMSGGRYRIVDQDVDENGVGGLKFDAFVGFAYTSLDADLDVGPLGFGGKESWFDPLVGARARFNFTEWWGASFDGYIGGFDLFNGSKRFSQFEVTVGRHFGEKKNMTLYAGYREMYVDYDHGSGPTKFEFDVNIYGPVLGFEMKF